MEISMIEKHQAFKTSSSIAIRPYLTNSSNMGLERYQMALFPGIFHEEPLICLQQNGIKRYVTGLNEFAPEVKMLPDDEREAKIKQIRILVSQLEKELASNVVDPTDSDFWNKIKLLHPNNDAFWEKIFIRVSNEPVFLDPIKDPYDLIKLKAIEEGGFSLVAPSLDAARKMAKPPKFYLDKYEETVAIKTEVKKLRNKALAELEKLYNKNANKLFLVAKVIDANSTQYRKTTPNDVIYDNMDKYINGESVDKDKRKTAERFLEIAGLDNETLKLRAIVKDATIYKIVVLKPDGFIYHGKSGAMLGKTPSEIVQYLKNPLNEEILMDIMKTVEEYWK
jgi:hypothetical protein